jgi:type VI secretion system secreted protein VgrG
MATTAPNYSQATRPVRFHCKLPQDTLLLTGFSGSESVSAPFRYDVELISIEPGIKPADMLHTNASLELDLPGGTTRKINGIITRFAQGTQREDLYTRYRLELAPPFGVRTRSFQSRIFQKKSVPDIVKIVLGELKIEFKLELRGAFPTREYCVQYRETDLAFVSRLLEEEGIFYFLEHDGGKVVLHMSNSSQGAPSCPGQAALRFAEQIVGDEDIITSIRHEGSVPLGSINLRDYDELQPGLSLDATEVGDGDGGASFEYPGKFKDLDAGRRYARLALEAEEALQKTVAGESTSRNFIAGHAFKVRQRPGDTDEYVLLKVKHRCEMPDYRTGGSGLDYRNEFVAIPKTVPYRPVRTIPRPLMRGCQTAVVVGRKGEEIFVDKYGRVKVQFHWDRHGKKDENSSCWVRVATPWAGKQWGAVHIPRIGQEVIVDFLEGDPDQPIIIGSVYNAEMMPPYQLPDNMTQSGIKSRSTLRGGTEDFNELRFEDKKGSEHIYVHAQKDKIVIVENNRDESVGKDERIAIGNNRTESVEGNESVSITKNQTLSVGGNRSQSVDKDETQSVEGNRSRSVGKDEKIEVSGNRKKLVSKKEEIEIGDDRSVAISKDDQLNVGKKWTVTAGDQITLKTGDASIVMKKDGTITIKGKDITIQGSGKINVKADSDVTIKGSQIKQN